MPRSGDLARQRLQEAALQLYARQGYDNTTTAEIAQCAGVTERTYFRHFADKREVLFDGELELGQTLARAAAGAPDGMNPLEVSLLAYRAVIPLFVEGRPVAERRARIIATSAALQERAHAKAVHLTQMLTEALIARAVEPGEASLAARISAVLFNGAMKAWDGTSGDELDALLDQSVNRLRGLINAI